MDNFTELNKNTLKTVQTKQITINIVTSYSLGNLKQILSKYN